MNAQLTIVKAPDVVRLKVDDFLMLKRAGAFRGYEKSELLDGLLMGVPRAVDGKPQSDASFPIKLRVEDYEKLDLAGAFGGDCKTELVDGAVYRMSPQYRQHGFVKDEFAYRLRRRLEELTLSLQVATEQSVELSQHSQPQPDVILTNERQGTGAIPGASVALIIEVSVSTLSFDLGKKAEIFATAGVPEYWVVDVPAAVIHQMWMPQPSGYAERRETSFGERIEAVTIGGLTIETDGLQ